MLVVVSFGVFDVWVVMVWFCVWSNCLLKLVCFVGYYVSRRLVCAVAVRVACCYWIACDLFGIL